MKTKIEENIYMDYYEKACEEYIMNQDTERAVQMFHKVIQLNPDFADAFFDLGYIYISLGKKHEAVYYFRNYLDKKPFAHDKKEIEALIETLKLVDIPKLSIRFIKKEVVI